MGRRSSVVRMGMKFEGRVWQNFSPFFCIVSGSVRADVVLFPHLSLAIRFGGIIGVFNFQSTVSILELHTMQQAVY
jgi:hypothetical protein